MAEMFVQPVAVERCPWSGTGTFVSAREIDAADLNSGGPAARVRAQGRLRAAGQRD